jgi:spore maturation protein CgeB
VRWLIVLPFERPELMGMDFAAELSRLGHEVRTFAYRRENVLYKNRSTKRAYQRLIRRRLESTAESWRPHVVLVIKGGPIAPDLIARIRRRTGARFVNVFPDNPLWMLEFDHIEPYDLFFTKDRYALRQLQLAGLRHVEYLAAYCVPDFHHPVTPTAEERERVAGHASLVGARYPYRERFLVAIADLPVRVWGPGWHRSRDARVQALVAGGRVAGRAKLAIYCASPVSLNLHHPMNDIAGTNTRTFELAAAGACQLADYRDDLAALFKPGQELLTFRDLPDLRRQLVYHVAHPDESRAIGENARRRALAEHTIGHRVAEILDALQDRLGGLA